MDTNKIGNEKILTKTLIITGIEDQNSQLILKEKLEKEFEAKETYTIPNNYNVLFSIFYDERQAKKAKLSLKNDENLNSYYTISKYEIPREGDKCDSTKNQSSIFFIFKNLTSAVIDTDFVIKLSNEFGEVKAVKMTKNFQKCIEFYDSRVAKEVFEKMDDSKYREGSVHCRWTWDLGAKIRWDLIKATDSVLKECKVDISKVGKKVSAEEPEPVKKVKIVEVAPSNKNIFIEMFDEFIANNIDKIEKNYI